MAELVAPLQEAHADWAITIKAVRPEVLLAQIGKPAGPDAALVSLASLPPLIKDRRLLSLDAHLSERDRLDFLPAAWKRVTVDGHTWAVPFELSCLALMYRKSALFAAETPVPVTTADLMLRGIAFQKKQPKQAFMSLPTEPATLLPFLWAHGSKTLTPDPRWRATTQYLLTLRSRQVIGPFHQTQRSSVDVLASGRAAMAIGSPENLPQLNDLTAADDLGIAPVPSGSDAARSPMVGRAWVLSPSAPRLDAALVAVTALAGRESAARWNARLSRLPARTSAYDEPVVRQRPALALFRDQLVNAKLLKEADLEALETLAPQWRPYLTGQKKLEMPKAPMGGKPLPSASPKEPAAGLR
ncbi:MAG: extracellular solute-binding protein [Candidatus Sericytochromatia bacterium]|nr:extracellular solute-binding protein [Candidatus Sericytochromatia bacterium]